MPKFRMQPLVGDNDDTSAYLGATADTAGNFAETEIGKPVKLTGNSRYVLAAVNDDLEGIVVSLESSTIDGYSFGTVRRGRRINATLVGAGVIGNQVVVDASNPAKGTAYPAGEKVKVKVGTPVVVKWRIVDINGTDVVLERV